MGIGKYSALLSIDLFLSHTDPDLDYTLPYRNGSRHLCCDNILNAAHPGYYHASGIPIYTQVHDGGYS